MVLLVVTEHPQCLLLVGIDLQPHVQRDDFQVGHLAGQLSPLALAVEREGALLRTVIRETGLADEHAVKEDAVVAVGTVERPRPLVVVVFQ